MSSQHNNAVMLYDQVHENPVRGPAHHVVHLSKDDTYCKNWQYFDKQ